MLISMALEELEFVVAALGSRPGHPVGVSLYQRLAQQAQYERRQREPVKVAMTLNGCEYAAILNPESDEVEVRIGGIPAMSGEWRKDWFREGIDEEPEHPSIQRRDEYEGQPQPDDATLEVLSVALRHALVYR
jgi:hypothetical protein